MTFFVDGKMITPEVEQALRRVVAQKGEVAALDAEINSRKTQVSSISEDQQRLRENLKVLKGSAEEKALVERYARELNTQEDRVQSLQKEIAELHQKRGAAQETLNEMIQNLQIETTI
jgi:chromosome segregation ATPase